MINKILKVELIILFLFTLLAFVAFYYQSILPDNFFSISSSSEKVNFLSYYFVTFVASIGFYTGPWIFLPFLLFSIFYALKFSKREYIGDSFLVVSLLLFFMSFSLLFVPELLGSGLYYILDNTVSSLLAVFVLLTSILAFLFGSFRSTFKEMLVEFYNFILSLPDLFHKALLRRKHSFSYNPGHSDRHFKRIRMFLPRLLQGIKAKGESDKDSRPMIAGRSSYDENSKNESQYQQKNFFQESMSTKEDVADPENTNILTAKIIDMKNDDISSDQSNETKLVNGHLKQKVDLESDQKYRDLLDGVRLQSNYKQVVHPNDKYFDEIINLIEDKLSEFKINGQIINILKGPVVDTFELELGSGVKVSKVTGASEDLSLALYGAPIRIVYPMKGRTTVGIEVPRNPREIIYLEELIDSQEYINSDHLLPVAMGKDAFGDAFIVDLAKMPHMLVAGATGAGKSVFINAILVSLLLKKSPQQMQLILIDPKQLELALYSKLPHLAMPIVTDAKTASIALLWATQEMERRYSILKDFGVRNMASFNEKLKNANPAMLAKIHYHYENSSSNDYELPFLVIVIDEFADLILTKAGKEIECNVSRLAAKARAAGIHLVLATQRPSVDVITGVIKSNFPTRVSFRVSSQTDSRTILDKMGAERLLGKGDMLYKHGIETMRVHSSFVDEKEIENISDQLEDMEPNFSEHIMDFLENGGDVEVDAYTYGSHLPSVDDKSTDNMFKEAMKVCAEQGSASASMLQRRLKIGYNRAANLIDELEEKGVVGPAQGSKPREVLISPDGT